MPPSIALVNTIRKPADTIRKSADSLIVFSNAIRRSTVRTIASAEASSRQERAWALVIEKERTCCGAGSLFAWRGGPC